MTEALVPFDVEDRELADQVPDRFAVRDEASANWVVRRIVEARAYAERVKAWAEREQRRAKREEQFFLRRFGPELEGWLKEELAARKSRQKSIALPAGRVGRRIVKNKLVVDDQAAALDWARQHCPDAVETTQHLIKTPLNEHVARTGELPPGVSLQPQHESLSIT